MGLMCRRALLCGSKRGPPRHQQYMATRRWWLSGCCIETTREMAAWLMEAEGGLATLCHASLRHAGLPAEASDKPLPQHWATPGSADVTTRTDRFEGSAKRISGGHHRRDGLSQADWALLLFMASISSAFALRGQACHSSLMGSTCEQAVVKVCCKKCADRPSGVVATSDRSLILRQL